MVTISANTSGAGIVFDKWTGNTANVANINMPNTTITMPSCAAEVTATYKIRGATPYILTVNYGTGGSGAAGYLPGTVVTISANTSGAGIVFDKWIGNTANVANINLPNTTIIMPSCAAEVTATYKDQGSDLLLTVNYGTGGGTYKAGTVVTISANTSGAGIVFDKWIGDTAYIANINLTNTTFVMPSHAAAVTATYKNRGGATFTLTVTTGTGTGHYLPGTVVDIAANKASAGYVFDRWVGNTANVENINLPNTIIQMPFADSTVVASYKAQVVTKYALTVTSGTGDGEYLPGAAVNISANAPAAGKMFDQWTGDTANITNINLLDTIIIMPSRSTAITATYKDQGSSYGLTVNSGTGAGTYTEGTVVSISANTSGAGIVFDKWTGDSTYIANINLPNTAFVMPSHVAAVTATYIDQGVGTFTLTVNDGTGGNTVTGYLPGTVVDIAANKPPTGKIFDGWIGNTANIENINLPNTTILMPFSNTEITATYIDQGSGYTTLTVTDGTGGGSYLPGTVVAISANTSGSGVVFDKWIGDTANIANIFLPNTTIYTPFYSATVVAIYKVKASPIVNYPLIVTEGSGDGSYPPGTCVSIMADTATSGAGLIFDKWTGQTARVTNIHQSETTLLMPFSAATVIATYTTQGAISYILTVNSGKGDGTYLPGSVVNIEADVAPAGQVFDKWIGQTDHIRNIYLPYTVIVMPLANTEITATYRDQEDETYALTVTNGDGDGVYLPGTVVNISANTSGAGIVFDKWVGQTSNIANINLPNTSIRIPFSPVTVIATYTTQGAITYTLTVNSGEGGGSYPSGSEVNIAANAAPAGQVFDKWVGQTANIANVNLPNTTIQMSFANTAVTATYKISSIQTYTLTVTDGTGGGVYLPGTVINIVANAAPSGYVFEKWIEQTNHVANINLPSTTIIMPFSETTAIATYRAQGVTTRPLYIYSGTGSGIYLPGTVVNIFASTSGAGIVFDKWVGQTSHIANINLPNTTLNMPFSGGPTDSLSSLLNTIISMLSLDSESTSTTVEATYKSAGAAHALTVTNGTGSGIYQAGTVVTISADTSAAGYIFGKWIGQIAPLENINNATTTVYMPSNDMAVQAIYNCLVTATASTGGTVSPASQTVANGNTAQFTATTTVSSCSRLDTVSGDCPTGTWSGNTYTTGIITTGCQVTFNFVCASPSPGPGPGPNPSLPPTLLVDPSGRTVAKEAGTTTFTVNNGGDGTINWSAAVTSQSSWLSITSGASGVNSGTIVISYAANTSNEKRTGAIRITANGAEGSPKDVTVTQEDSGKPVLSVAPANRDVTKDAGSTTFTVSNTGTGAMKWVSQVISGGEWLSITSGSSGTTTGSITCNYTEFTGTTSRIGIIRVTATDTGNPRDITGSPKDVTVTQNVYTRIVSNTIGGLNFIKISDLSGALSTDGGCINVKAWDVNGMELPESVNASVLKLFNYGTTMIQGSDIAGRFPSGAPMLYEFYVDAAIMVITNVKDSVDGVVRVPTSYTRGLNNYVSNFTGTRNFIKISDMSGALPANGALISANAWDVDGHALPESLDAVPIKLYNYGTTITEGSDLAARFITGIPMTYKFSVESDKFLLTDVKRSTDDQLQVPVVYPYGLSNYVSNSTGPYNTLYVSDLSGTLPAEGGVIGVKAWDVDGHAILESGAVTPLKLRNHGMTVVDDTELVARFSAGAPMTYEFKVDSAKVLILNGKSSMDGMITAPVIYTKGISNFVMNNVSTLNTIKISDVSGALSGSGGAISIKAWDVNGKSLMESDGAAPLKLNNHGTTILEGTAITARFPGGTPATYEFSIGSSRALVTVLTKNQDGTIKIPTVFTIGDCTGI